MRIHGLDSIRGIAALIVVFNHFYNVVPFLKTDNHWLFNFTPVYWLIAGRFAVILFFMLSGFVLALPYFQLKEQSYSQYITKRICRIYLPFMVAVILASVLCHGFAEPRPLWALGNTDWSQPVTMNLLLQHLLMAGTNYTTITLDHPMWSLIIEMRISIIFPLLVLLVSRFRWWAVPGSLILGYSAAKVFVIFFGNDFYEGESAFGAIVLTLYYVPFFMIGIMMASIIDTLKIWVQTIPQKAHLLIIATIFLTPHFFFKSHFMFTDLWYGIASAYVILCSIGLTKVNLALSLGLFKWLGRVSYSLYLIHMPVLLAVLYVFHDTFGFATILLIAFPLVLMAAEIMNRLVERPSIQLGKQLSASLLRPNLQYS